MIKKLLLAGLTIFGFSNRAQNFVASYGFANVSASTGTVDPTPVPVVNGATFSPFTAVGSFTNPNASGRFTYTGWPTGATNGVDTYSNYTGALTPTVYYEVSIAPMPGYSLTLNSLIFSMRRSSTGVRNFAVRSSVDSYSNNLPATVTASNMSVVTPDIFFWTYDATSNTSDQRGNTITLGGQSFSALTNSVSFRFYAWNSEGAGGTFSIDSVVFNGFASNGTQTLNTTYIQQEATNEQVSVWPNPTHGGIVTIQAAGKIENVELINLLGEVVFRQKNPNADERLNLNLTNLSEGTYFMRVSGSNRVLQTKKLVLSH